MHITTPEIMNPLDVVEGLASERPWICERLTSHRLQLYFVGEWADYDFALSWSEDTSCLHLAALFGVELKQVPQQEIFTLLAQINAQLWFGFFSLREGHILYCHSHLFADQAISAASCDGLVEIAHAALDRWSVAFYLLAQGRSAWDAAQAAQMEGNA